MFTPPAILNIRTTIRWRDRVFSFLSIARIFIAYPSFFSSRNRWMRFNVLRSRLQHASIHENVAVQMQVSLVLPCALRDLHGTYRGIHLQITLLPTYDVYICLQISSLPTIKSIFEKAGKTTREKHTCRSHIQYIYVIIYKNKAKYTNNNCVSNVFVISFDRNWFCKILSAISGPFRDIKSNHGIAKKYQIKINLNITLDTEFSRPILSYSPVTFYICIVYIYILDLDAAYIDMIML